MIPDILKALSLSNPWCWSIFDPIADKGIENRSWAPPIAVIGQTIAIHAAKSWDDKREYRCGPECYRPHEFADPAFTPTGYLMHHGLGHMPMRKDRFISSAIVGVATIDRVITDARELYGHGLAIHRRWFFGPFGWVLTNRRKLPRPIPIGGKQGLWTVPAEHVTEIRNQLAEVN